MADKEALITFRMERARETLFEAQVQMDNALWRVAVNRLYFACFYAITALLVTKDDYPKTHKGLKQRFALLFVTTKVVPLHLADTFSELFDRRNSGDYDDFFDVDRSTVDRLQWNSCNWLTRW